MQQLNNNFSERSKSPTGNCRAFLLSFLVGRLIPAGTGGTIAQICHIVTTRDDLIVDERCKSTGGEAANAMLTDMTHTAAE